MLDIGFACNDATLINKFKGIEYFNKFKISNDLKNFKDIDILIISDTLVDVNKLLGAREKELKHINYVFYMVSNENYKHNLNDIFSANNINMIPPKLTTSQILEKVCQLTIDEMNSEKNIITFFGADAKVGTTQIALSVAERIAEKTDLKVFLASLNGKINDDYIDITSDFNLDTIKVKLASKILNVSELINVCIKKGNLFILKGANSILEVRHYTPEYIEYLLQLVSSEFDVIIIDAGSNIELGMTIGSLNSTNYRYLVTTQQESAFKNYKRLDQQVLSKYLKIEDFLMIVNKYVDEPMLYTPYQLGQMYDNTLVSTLPYLSWGWQSEKDKKSLLNYNDTEFIKGIDKIVKLIAKQLHFKYQEEEQKKGWFNKLKAKIS